MILSLDLAVITIMDIIATANIIAATVPNSGTYLLMNRGMKKKCSIRVNQK